MKRTKIKKYVLEKMFWRLRNVIKFPYTISVDEEVFYLVPPEKINVSEKFFRSAKCKRCGKCCRVGFTRGLIYTDSDLKLIEKELTIASSEEKEKISKLLNSMTQISFVISSLGKSWNSKIYFYYNYNDSCDFVDGNYCSIHKVKPVHCALPTMEFDRVKDSARLIKRPRGRNWRYGCPIEFGSFDPQEFKTWDFPVLKRFQYQLEDLGIQSWMPEILCYLEKEAYSNPYIRKAFFEV